MTTMVHMISQSFPSLTIRCTSCFLPRWEAWLLVDNIFAGEPVIYLSESRTHHLCPLEVFVMNAETLFYLF